MWECPNCENEVCQLRYSRPVIGHEYGNFDLPSPGSNARGRAMSPEDMDSLGDYESDNEETNWDGSPEYECMECDRTLFLNELVWRDSPSLPETLTVSDQPARPGVTFAPSEIQTGRNGILTAGEGWERSMEEPTNILEEDEEARVNISNNQISSLFSNERGDDTTDTTIICKECKHIIICDARANEEEYIECEECQTLNTKKEYRQLIEQRFYSTN